MKLVLSTLRKVKSDHKKYSIKKIAFEELCRGFTALQQKKMNETGKYLK